MADRYKIIGIFQCYNELRTGNLTRFIDHVKPLVSEFVAYDDASTDGSFEYLSQHVSHVIRGLRNDFVHEMSHKQVLLDHALKLRPDFILWLDVDEILTTNAATQLQILCDECVRNDMDGVSFHKLNLWRSLSWRRTDSLYDDGWFVQLWRARQDLAYGVLSPGLHQRAAPPSIQRILRTEEVAVIHYGFSSEHALARKYLIYRLHGQRGQMLTRLIDESGLQVEQVPVQLFPDDLQVVDQHPTPYTFQDAFAYVNRLRDDVLVPGVSIVCLIYKSVSWLRFVYDQLLRNTYLEQKEFFFVANDASDEVLAYLHDNYIPHVIWNNTEEQRKEFYINNVYRAWNYGARVARGDYLLFINSDMAFTPDWFERLFEKLDSRTCIVSRLVESGKLRSGTHGISRDFGRTIEAFNEQGFINFASSISEHSVADDGLFMPLLVRRDDFWKAGGYPEGNVVPGSDPWRPRIALPEKPCISGDQVFMHKLARLGIRHRTAFDSIVYHFQCGEQDSDDIGGSGSASTRVVVCNDLLTGQMGEKTMWDFLLERLPNVVGVDSRTVGKQGKYEVLARSFIDSRYRSVKVSLQNASFIDIVCRDKFTVVYLQDDLRRMRRRSRQQEENLRCAQMIVSNSRYTASSYPEYDIRIIPIGVDSELFRPMNKWILREKHGLEDKGKIGIFVGAFDEVKGWPVLQSVIEDRLDIFWILVSKDQQSYTNHNALVLHRIAQTELVELLNCADFFILGSPVETQCLAAIEACLCDVPVVMRKTGIFADFSQGELDQIGVFGSDFDRGIDEVYTRTFAPRAVMMERRLTVAGMVANWHKVLTEASIRAEASTMYTGSGHGVGSVAQRHKHRIGIRELHSSFLRELGYILPDPVYRFIVAADLAAYRTGRVLVRVVKDLIAWGLKFRAVRGLVSESFREQSIGQPGTGVRSRTLGLATRASERLRHIFVRRSR